MRTNPITKLRNYILRKRYPDLPEHVDFVMIGTTGLCNASCIHCPTGKLSTANSPRTPMPMPLFKKLIDQLAEMPIGKPVHLSFGLFGDGLVDSHVLERAIYARQKLPRQNIVLNTNGAAFDEKKHAPLADLVSMVALHCESLDEQTYNTLMKPLRFKNVYPKYQRIIDTFPGKVHVSVPISRLNREQAPAIREAFLAWGAANVQFDPLSNRLSTDPALFESLSLAPMKINCKPTELNNLIIDCDGKVLVCCQDFSREEPIGSLADQSLLQVLSSRERARVRRLFAEERHDEMKTCSRCWGDARHGNYPENYEKNLGLPPKTTPIDIDALIPG